MARVGFASGSKEKLKLRLELTEPNRREGEDTWELTATATVIGSDGPVPDVEVRFYHNGRPHDPPISTDGEGRAVYDFGDLVKGKHTFTAQIVGATTQTSQKKEIKEDEPKKVSRLLVSSTKRGNEHTLFLQALTEKDLPVKGAVIRITDPSAQSGYRDLPSTGKDGAVTAPFMFTGSRLQLHAFVLGTHVQEWTWLFN